MPFLKITLPAKFDPTKTIVLGDDTHTETIQPSMDNPNGGIDRVEMPKRPGTPKSKSSQKP